MLWGGVSDVGAPSGLIEPDCNCVLRRRNAGVHDILVLAGPLGIYKNFARPPGGQSLPERRLGVAMQCGAGPWISMESGDPAPLARPHLVPTRDWGVVVDTGSVAETNLADSRLSLKLRESVKAEPSRQRLSERHREPKRYSGLPPTGMLMASDGNRHRTGRTEMAPRAGQRKQQ